MDFAVETFNLTKKYGRNVALDSLNIKFERGKIAVLLGPNGSGKTTFLHLISTVLKPTNGTARVLGYDIVKEQIKVREKVGIAFQEPRGFWRHKPRHILSFHASIYGIDGQSRKKAVEQALIEFDLWDARDKKFMDLSGGQAKRLEVAKIFIQRPELALFDEPTAMVDLDGKRLIWDKIKELKENGSTVIVATNEVREAEYLADVITIFARGKHVVTSSLQELKDMIKGADRVELSLACSVTNEIIKEISGIEGTYRIYPSSESSVVVNVSRSEDWLPRLMDKLHSLGVKIRSVSIKEPSLDDVFVKLIGENDENKDS